MDLSQLDQTELMGVLVLQLWSVFIAVVDSAPIGTSNPVFPWSPDKILENIYVYLCNRKAKKRHQDLWAHNLLYSFECDDQNCSKANKVVKWQNKCDQ